MIEPIFVNTLLTVPLRPGVQATAATATDPGGQYVFHQVLTGRIVPECNHVVFDALHVRCPFV
jgi:hypothetical protein